MPSTTIADVTTRLRQRYRHVRSLTDQICQPLSAEDCAVQSIPDVSPTRWHLAHTTWFFETFILCKVPNYRPFDPTFAHLFNSYYNSLGNPFPRSERGQLSRPSLVEVHAYREHVDRAMLEHLESEIPDETVRSIDIGLHHEQQHQELMLTDIKHVLSRNPTMPAYRDAAWRAPQDSPARNWREFGEGIQWIGHEGDAFAYDNESPRHRVFQDAFRLQCQAVTCGQYVEFIEEGGYRHPEYWLSLGWQTTTDQGWEAPLYWFREGDDWWQFTLSGPRPVEATLPVTHVSYFEADAFARWSGARLPTEAEWEIASATVPLEGDFSDDLLEDDLTIHPGMVTEQLPAAAAETPMRRMIGDRWEWTSSPYVPYPGYRPPAGALGEYNGKFMCNQYVLRGGSCATPRHHIRRTYRNFFPPEARWQFSGIRLAQDNRPRTGA